MSICNCNIFISYITVQWLKPVSTANVNSTVFKVLYSIILKLFYNIFYNIL